MPTVNIAEVINELGDEISSMSEAKGFWDPDDIGDLGIVGVKLALIKGEAHEALEIHREQYDDSDEDLNSRMTEMQEDDFTEELADVIIRTLDLARYFDLSIGEAIIDKMDKNSTRPYRHGKRY